MITKGGLSQSGRRDLSALFGGGEQTVTVERAAEILEITHPTAARRLAAWTAQGWLRRIRQGLYLAVPVDVPDPASWTADPWFLADLAWSPCYITGWSAASHWALSDQIFRTTVVATATRVRGVTQELAGNAYLVRKVPEERFEWGLRSEWRAGRRIFVADPAKCLAEMLGSPDLGGGIRHVLEILDAYLADQDVHELIDALDRLGNGAAFKRLGYLVERFDMLDEATVGTISGRITSGISSLDPSLSAQGTRVMRWGLLVNVDVGA